MVLRDRSTNAVTRAESQFLRIPIKLDGRLEGPFANHGGGPKTDVNRSADQRDAYQCQSVRLQNGQPCDGRLDYSSKST
jgi:hypothetical protein